MILRFTYQTKNGTKSLRAKTWLLLKLTILFLLFFTPQADAKNYALHVTLARKNVQLSDVFIAIEQQTGFLFFYDKVLVGKTAAVDITLVNATLDEALLACLKDRQLTYRIIKNNIFIQSEKTVSALPKNISLNIDEPPPPVEIHGRVSNQNGEPLQNVSIVIAGTRIGTTTDRDGRFTITAPDNNSVLEISSIGFRTKKVSLRNSTTINVQLEE